ncbi:MAG: hypothetical protein R3E96_13435 [Planctomycetota bacterium]
MGAADGKRWSLRGKHRDELEVEAVALPLMPPDLGLPPAPWGQSWSS